MRLLTLAAALFTSSLPTSALAENWIFVGKNNSGTLFSIDLDSIETQPNGYKRARDRGHLPTPVDGITGWTAYAEYDCRLRRMRTLQVIYFAGDVVSEIVSTPEPWSYAAPSSAELSVLEFVCFEKLPN